MKRKFPLKSTALISCRVLFVLVFLSGCYMPIRYDAEIAIHRTSHYEFNFDGYLARIELFQSFS